MTSNIDSAIKNLGRDEILTVQINVLTMVVHALITSHPEPQKFKAAFQLIYGESQASSAFMQMHPDAALAFRTFSQTFISLTEKS